MVHESHHKRAIKKKMKENQDIWNNLVPITWQSEINKDEEATYNR